MPDDDRIEEPDPLGDLDAVVRAFYGLAERGLAWDRDTLGCLYASVEDLIRELRGYLDEVAGAMLRQVESKITTVDGVPGHFERVTDSAVRWSHDSLLRRIGEVALDRRVVDRETGELESPEEAALRLIRECASIAYWRKGKLRELGVDPDEFSERERPRQRLVHRR